MKICRHVTLAALLSVGAATVWAADPIQAQPPSGQAQPSVGQAQSGKKVQTPVNEHRMKRREAQQRLQKAIEERAARKNNPDAELAAPTSVKGGAK